MVTKVELPLNQKSDKTLPSSSTKSYLSKSFLSIHKHLHIKISKMEVN